MDTYVNCSSIRAMLLLFCINVDKIKCLDNICSEMKIAFSSFFLEAGKQARDGKAGGRKKRGWAGRKGAW